MRRSPGRFSTTRTSRPRAEPAPESPARPHGLGARRRSRLRVEWCYSADLHDRATVERLAAAYAERLRELVAQSRTAEPAYSPEDFTQVELEQEDFDNLLAELDEAAS